MKKLIFLILCISLYAKQTVDLTKEEKNFLNSHIIKCATTTTWPPFNTLKNGVLAGISVSFWQLIKKELSINSRCDIYKNWSEVLNAIKTKKEDVTLGTEKTKDKEKFAIFSKPYATFHAAIATRNNVGFIASMIFLKNKKIVVGKNYTVAKLLKKHYPQLNIIEVKNIKTALDMVSNGKAYAAIDIMPVLIYNINKYEYGNLKIAGKTPLSIKLRFMIREDYTLLQSAINKAIDKITTNEKKEIYKEWISVNYQQGFTLKQILIFAVFVFIIIVIFVYWIYILKKDIKNKEILEKKLEKLSTIDALTNVYNRFKIQDILKKEISFARRNNLPLSVIFFDIDNFKLINDTYGHIIGDIVLKELTDMIKKHIRDYDYLGRWGGEEFLIILPNTNLSNAVSVAEKLRKIIQEHNFKHIGHLTCSFGVTELKESDTLESLIIRVDDLMYKAKKEGKNRVKNF